MAAAEQTLRRSLELFSGLSGAHSTAVSSAMNELAQVLERRGDLAGAEDLYRKAIAIDTATLGTDHPQVAHNLHNLAVVPHFGDEHDDAHGQKLERTVAMAPAALPVVALPARTALIRRSDGAWSSAGVGQPVVFVGGAQTDGLSALKG